MILFFPQYQAGIVPSHIPVGTPALRELWRGAPDFAEVPLQETDPASPEVEGNIKFRRILKKQLQDALAIVEAANPDFILTTGGDCGASFAPISYMNEKYGGKIGVVWVDAHADIHTPTTTPSQNYHGMVVRHLMGDLEFAIQPRVALKPQQIAYLGLRDTESAEDEAIAAYGIPRFSAREVMDTNAPMDAVIDHFKKNGITHLYLHVDCDVMDETVFPYVEVPEPGGLSLERLIEILKYMRDKMPMAGCCLTEYAPRAPGLGLSSVKRVYTKGLGMLLPSAENYSFHEATILSIHHEGDGATMSVQDVRRGKDVVDTDIVITGIKEVRVGDVLVPSLKMKYPDGEILSLDIQEDGLELIVIWNDFEQKKSSTQAVMVSFENCVVLPK